MLFVRDFLDDQVVHRNEDAPANPLVSVILPTYARLRSGMLDRAVRSVLSQTFRDFELIVVDDGSVDGTKDYVTRRRADDPRVVHVRHERNSGLPGLRTNEGIALARGRHVAFQFDDDAWRPNLLAALTDAAEGLGHEAVIVGTSIFHRDEHAQHAPFVAVNHASLFENNRFANNCTLIPRAVFDRHGMYDPHIGMRRACDWDLWLRLIRDVPFHVVEEIVADVYTFQEGSLGETTPWDLGVFRYLHDIPRDHLLTPARWADYPIDSLRIGDVPLRGEFARRIYEEYILPFYLRFRHQLPLNGGLPPWPSDGPSGDAVLVVDNDFDDRFYNTIIACDRLSSRRGGYKVHRQHATQVGVGAGVDAVMLGRLDRHRDEGLAHVAREAGRPVAYLLDADPFAEPGDAGAAARLVAGADAVWLADPALVPTAAAYNRRIVALADAVPPGALPARIRPRDPDRPVTIGYAGSVPLEELGFLQDALGRVVAEFGDRVRIAEGWSDAPAPGTAGYAERLNRLRDAGLDILLAPLPDGPRPGGRPSPTPGHEAAVAGSLGIVSDVPAFEAMLGEETCLKAANTAAGWADALRRAITMPAGEFDRMRAAGLAHARDAGTAEARVEAYEAAWRATEFHRQTRHRRGRDGRPRVAYVFHSQYIAGAEIQLWRRLRLMPAFGIEPIAVLPRAVEGSDATHATREMLAREGIELVFADYSYHVEPVLPPEHELPGLRALLGEMQPALVHSTTYMASVGRACRELGIPHVASIYAIEESVDRDPAIRPWARAHCDLVQSDSLRYSRQWGDMLGVEPFCARNLVPEPLFDLGRRRLATPVASGEGEVVRVALLGTVQPRKGQFAAVAAVGDLRREGLSVELDVHGYTQFYPEFLRACERRIAEDRAEGAIRFLGFNPAPASALKDADILLCSSNFESFPTSISEAMAAGVLVVSTPAGGIAELIVDGVSGILCRGFSDLDVLDGLRRAVRMSPEERRRIVEQARRVALEEFHPDRVANALFRAYGQAIRNREAYTGPVLSAAPIEPVMVPEPQPVPEAETAPAPDPGPEPVATPEAAPMVEPVAMPDPVASVPPSLRRRVFAKAKRAARKVDSRILRMLRVPHPAGVQPGPAGAMVHPAHGQGGPHRLGRAYCRLRRLARRVDSSLSKTARDATP